MRAGIDFTDAARVLSDPHAFSGEDVQAEGEQRFVAVGMDRLRRILTVVYTYRGDGMRLISARRGPIIAPYPDATEIRLRVDNDLLDWCRAQMHAQGGGDYEDLINGALRAYRDYAERIQLRLNCRVKAQ